MDVSRPEHYYQVALERIKQAESLYREGKSYALSMYVAGVAVESMLRAYRAKKSMQFDARHDVSALFDESDMLKTGAAKLRAKGWSENDLNEFCQALDNAVHDVCILWHNNYRYASEERLLAHLKRVKLYQGVKGDVLKARALQLLKVASLVIEKGTLLWQ